MAKKKSSPSNYFRLILQWGVGLLLLYMVIRPLIDKNYFPDFEAYCPFGGMQSLASYFSSHSLACSMTTVQIALGIALLLAAVLFSKLFCSYICPVGTFTEWLGKLGAKAKLLYTVKGKADKYLRVLKYALLFITVYFTVSESELFCRKYDPFYAAFTGFSGDVYIWFAIPALVLTIAGSFFIRQFWCKYLCPLGAITNIGVYALPAATLTLLWVLLTSVAGLTIPWPWLLGSICLTGFLFEATTLKYFIFPALRVTRTESLCTHCRICDKKCPMAINISTVDRVDHIDCHLCLDCVVKCPEKGALTINKRNLKWLPATAAVILTAIAITLGTYFELPTISENWSDLNAKNIKVFKMDGLKNIKCFGSSRSFANHMKEVKGVAGVETYVKHKRVVVYYNSEIISEKDVKEAIFSPLSELLNFKPGSTTLIQSVAMGIDRCFDPNDQGNLAALLQGDKGILAFKTQFGEPVESIIYFDPAITTIEKIKNIISAPFFIRGTGNNQQKIETGFVVSKTGTPQTVPLAEFLTLFFPVTDVQFNNFISYSDDEMLVYEISFTDAADTEMLKWIPFLVSHVSNEDGIVRLLTSYTSEGPVLKLWFVQSLISVDKISNVLSAEELIVHYPDKSVKRVKNPFTFSFNTEK